MKLWHYLFRRRVRMWSSRSMQDVSEAINKGTGSPYSFIHHGVAGDVHHGRVHLFWNYPLVGNLLQPSFNAGLSQSRGGTILVGYYGAGFFVRTVWFLWYAMVAFFAVIGFLSLQARGELDVATGVFIIVAVLALFPLALHFLLNWNADKHYAAMIELLEREAGLQLVEI